MRKRTSSYKNTCEGTDGILRTRTATTLLVLIACLAACARAADVPYTITADYIYFNIDKKVIECTGHALVEYQDLRISAENMRIDAKEEIIQAEGDVRVVTLRADPARAAPAAAPDARADIATVSTENLKDEIESTRSGDTASLNGEMLILDLKYLQGMLVQTRARVGKVYFQGTGLTPSAAIPNLRMPVFMDDVTSEPLTSLTARKMKISPADMYEAWHATIYIKGGKTLTLPYYTNDTGKVAPGNWRLKRIRYSSNDNFTMGVDVRYSEKKGKRGFVSLSYIDKGSRHFGVGIDQQMMLGGNISGSVSLEGMGTDDSSFGLNLNRYKGSRQHSLNLRYYNNGYENLNYSLTSRWGSKTLRGYVSSGWNRESGVGNYSSDFTLSPPTHYHDKKRKLSSSITYTMGVSDYTSAATRGTAFVGVSMNRSGWTVGKGGSISAGMSTGYGADTDGMPRNNFVANVTYNRDIGRTSMLSFSYRYRDEKSNGDRYNNQYITTSFNLGKGAKWNSFFSSSFDIDRGRFSTVQSTFNIKAGKKCDLAATAVYDLFENHFSDNIFHINYKFYGSNVNIHWYKESNDFVMDFVSISR